MTEAIQVLSRSYPPLFPPSTIQGALIKLGIADNEIQRIVEMSKGDPEDLLMQMIHGGANAHRQDGPNGVVFDWIHRVACPWARRMKNGSLLVSTFPHYGLEIIYGQSQDEYWKVSITMPRIFDAFVVEPEDTTGIDERVVALAAQAGVDAEDLDWHLEAEHGWEPHDDGYWSAIGLALACIQRSIAAGKTARECTEK